MTEFIPHETQFPARIKDIVQKLKKHENIKVIVLWITGNYQRLFFRKVSHQNVTDRVWILSEIYLSSSLKVMNFPISVLPYIAGSIGFLPHNFLDAGFQEHMKDLLSNEENLLEAEWWNDLEELKKLLIP